jgi:hypothetical protein
MATDSTLELFRQRSKNINSFRLQQQAALNVAQMRP